MKDKDLTIGLMIGSIRDERQTIKPATVLKSMLRKRGVSTSVLDLKKLDLPMFDDGLSHPGRTRLLNTYKKIDGLILISPEYNHSVPSPVKNAIDFAREGELLDKPLAIASTSGGGFGGVRMVDAMRSMWVGVGGITVPPTFATSKMADFDPKDPGAAWMERAERFLDESLWWFRVIKTGKLKEKK